MKSVFSLSLPLVLVCSLKEFASSVKDKFFAIIASLFLLALETCPLVLPLSFSLLNKCHVLWQRNFLFLFELWTANVHTKFLERDPFWNLEWLEGRYSCQTLFQDLMERKISKLTLESPMSTSESRWRLLVSRAHIQGSSTKTIYEKFKRIYFSKIVSDQRITHGHDHTFSGGSLQP